MEFFLFLLVCFLFERGEQNDVDLLLEYLIETMKIEGLNIICDIFTGFKEIKTICSHCQFENSFQSPFQILNIFLENEKKLENYLNFTEEKEKCPLIVLKFRCQELLE